MVLGINTISFSLIDNAAFIQQVVPILKCYHFLLFVGIEGLVHTRVVSVVHGAFGARITNHVVREVDHWAVLL